MFFLSLRILSVLNDLELHYKGFDNSFELKEIKGKNLMICVNKVL